MSRSVYRGGTRVLSLLCATMVALTMFVVTGARSVAEAAINNQITFPQIEIIRTDKGGNPEPSPDPLRIWEYAKLNIKFDATQANPQPGDSFEIEAPVYFALRESGEFPMTDTDGSPAGTCLLQERGGKPFITCTFGQAIAGKSDVEGTVAIGLQVDGGSGSDNAEIRINGQIHSVPLPNGQIVPPQFYNEPKVDKWLQSLVAKDSRYLQWSVQLGGKYWSDHKNELGDPISITDELQPGLEYVTGDPRHPVELLEVCADPAGPTGQKETVIARVGEPNIDGKGFSVEFAEDPGDSSMAHITFRGPIKGTCNYRVYYYTKFPNGETINKGQRYGNEAEFDGTGDSDEAWGFYVESFQAIVNFKDGFGSFKVTKLVNGDGFPGGQQFDVNIAYVLPDGKGPGDFPGWVAPSNPTRYTVKVGEGATYVAAFPVGTVVTLTEDLASANPAPATGLWTDYKFVTKEGGVTLSEGGKKAQFTVVNQKAFAFELQNTWTPKEFAPFKVAKTVVPGNIGSDKEFELTYECDSMGNQNTPATGMVRVAGGAVKEVGNFPIGAQCKITAENDVAIAGFTLGGKDFGQPVTIAKDAENVVTVTNTYNADGAPFAIKKVVNDNGSVGGNEFQVNYQCSAPGVSDAGVVVPAEGVATVAGNGAAKVIGTFPVGTDCKVTGEDQDAAARAGFTLAPDFGQPVQIAAGAVNEITVTNIYTQEFGVFVVAKAVVPAGQVGVPGEFTVDYSCSAAGRDGVAQQGSVRVAAGAETRVGEFPVGTVCEVTGEDEAAAGIAGFNLVVSKDGPVTLVKDAVSKVTVTNTYSEKVGRFSISKSVVADPGVVAPGEFRFWYQCGGDAQRSVMVAAGGVWTSPDLPAGTRCVVKEDLARAFVDGAELRTDFAGDVVDGVVTIGDGVTAGVRVTNTYVPELVSVGDFVWWDVNRDGQQTGGEPVAAGVEVALQRGDGSVVATTVTDADGFYWFKDLAAGRDYRLVFTAPDGASWTVQDQGGDDAKDSDVDAQGVIGFTSDAGGENLTGPGKTDDPTLDAGLVKYNLTLAKALTSVGKPVVGDEVVFELTPRNEGPVDAVAGWSVVDVPPGVLDVTEMTGEGYTCDVASLTCTSAVSLAAGELGKPITVKADVIADFTGTVRNLAYIAPSPADSLAETNPLVVPDPVEWTNMDIDPVNTVTDNDAAAELTTESRVSIGDFVWWDVDRDGLQDDGESPVPGVGVVLKDAQGNRVDDTVTDAGGFYWFNHLRPGGKYRLEFTAPEGASWTIQDQGGDDAKDSDVNPDGVIEFTAPAVGVNAGGAPDKTDDPRLDAGLVRYNLKLVKTLDAASRKQVNAGDEVTFLLTPHNDGPVAALPGWSITDVLPDGLTLVSMTGDAPWYDCLANVCTAKESLAAGADGPVVKITAKVDEAVPADALTNGLVNIAYITPAPTDGPETVPLGEEPGKNPPRETPTDNDDDEKVEIARVSIGDFVWWDVDRNGLQDNDEPPVPGVKVVLKDAAGQVVGETITDEYGYYGFKDLTPNTGYRLEFTAPEGASWTIQDQGGDDAKDSDVNPDGLIEFTSPVSGNNSIDRLKTDDPSLDAGLVKYNLVLVKDQQGRQKVKVGDQITYTLTPSNQGPADALAGWSITDVLPDYLELVSISGEGYTCDLTNPKAPTCTNPEPLGTGSPAKPVTVVVKVLESASGVIRNTGYITPAPTDTPETNPLETPPTPTTDTTTTTTDNDSHKDTILNRTPPTTKPGPPKTGS